MELVRKENRAGHGCEAASNRAPGSQDHSLREVGPEQAQLVERTCIRAIEKRRIHPGKYLHIAEVCSDVMCQSEVGKGGGVEISRLANACRNNLREVSA